MPHALALSSLKYRDVRLLSASRMFEWFGLVCSVSAAGGNPRNFGSRNEKLFIGSCSMISAAYVFIMAYYLGLKRNYVKACIWTLILPIAFLGGSKLYSNLSDRKLGPALTMLFKSLPNVLFPMIYISTEALRCIMNSSPDAKIDVGGHIERCGNPSHPTLWVSDFLGLSWVLTYLLPPLLPSDRIPTWGDVMKLNMGRLEGLQFTLFFMFTIEAPVLYALTNEEGTKLSNFLHGLIFVMIINGTLLLVLNLYEYVLKPICRPTTRPHASSSVTSEDAFLLPQASDSTINVL